MSIKGTVWFQIGGPFGGFRFGPPLHWKHAAEKPDIFRALEWAIMEAYKTLRPHPPTEWQRFAENAIPPSIKGRRVKLNIECYLMDNNDGVVLMRAFLSFRAWPFGGWVVYEGWCRTQAGEWTRLPAEELEDQW